MDSGFEALPPRTKGRRAEKRGRDETVVLPGFEGPPLKRSPPSEDAEVAAAGAAALLAEERAKAYEATCPTEKYEFLDHTADVQIHAWGNTFEEALAQTALGVYGYMTDPEALSVDHPSCTRLLEAKGHDLVSLLFDFLDQCLYAFASDDFIAKDIKVVEVTGPQADVATGKSAATVAEVLASPPPASSSSRATHTLRAVAYGEKFVVGKHPQGTEVKAITYSNMQLCTPQGTFTSNDAVEGGIVGGVGGAGEADGSGGGGSIAAAAAGEGTATHRYGTHDIFVIVDI